MKFFRLKAESNSERPLFNQIVSGSGWLLIIQGYERFINIIKMIVLAHLLTPEIFGKFGICMLIISTLDVVSEIGFQSALVQKQKNIDGYFDTVWTVNVLRGMIQFLIIFVTAPLIASFFNIPNSAYIIRIISLSYIFRGLKNVKVILFQKDLLFHKQFYLRFWITTIDLVTSLLLAFLLKNELALVYGYLGGTFAGLIASYWIISYVPKIKILKKEFKELFHFGVWVLGSDIVTYLNNNGDDAFVGKYLGTSDLGSYQMAFKFGNMQSSLITAIINKIAFPSFSKLQHDPGRLKESYLRLLAFNFSLILPLTIILMISAPLFVPIFLGDNWISIIIPLQIFCLSGCFRAILGVGGALYLAIGKPSLNFYINLIRLIMIITLIYPLSKIYGISGAALSILAGNLISLVAWVYHSIKETKINLYIHISTAIPTIISLVPSVAAMLLLSINTVLPGYPLFHFIIIILSGSITYLFCQYWLRNKSKYNFYNELKNIKRTIAF